MLTLCAKFPRRLLLLPALLLAACSQTAEREPPAVLTPFGQVESALARRHDGTGLGLPLAKCLVELHGGELDLQSREGEGTTVTVRLPAKRIGHTGKAVPDDVRAAGS